MKSTVESGIDRIVSLGKELRFMEEQQAKYIPLEQYVNCEDIIVELRGKIRDAAEDLIGTVDFLNSLDSL